MDRDFQDERTSLSGAAVLRTLDFHEEEFQVLANFATQLLAAEVGFGRLTNSGTCRPRARRKHFSSFRSQMRFLFWVWIHVDLTLAPDWLSWSHSFPPLDLSSVNAP